MGLLTDDEDEWAYWAPKYRFPIFSQVALRRLPPLPSSAWRLDLIPICSISNSAARRGYNGAVGLSFVSPLDVNTARIELAATE